MLVLDKPHPPHHTNVDKFSAVQSFCLLFKGIEWCHTHYIVYVYVYTVLKISAGIHTYAAELENSLILHNISFSVRTILGEC